MTSAFPLLTKAGLSVRLMRYAAMNTCEDVVLAAEVEKLLAAAPVVYGPSVERFDSPWSRDKVVFDSEGGKMSINAQARLLLIEPLVQESEERKLLRKIIEEMDADSCSMATYSAAKRLLGEGE